MLRIYFKRTVIYLLSLTSIFAILTHNLWSTEASAKRLSDLVALSKFLVNSPKCKILNLNPFDLSILQYVNKSARAVCASAPPLTTVAYNATTEQHVVRLLRSAVRHYTDSPRVRCCVKRLANNLFRVNFSPCQLFQDEFVMNRLSQFVFVFCLDNNNTIVYQNMHAGIVKLKKITKNGSENCKKLNVILLGLDSMSRLNFYRTMPKTATHLHTHGWVDMKGYNKVADNTLPNLMAILSGLPPDHFRRSQTLDLDNMPFVWKEFSRAGFATAYAEDQPLVSTFHCHLRGFQRLPTDHYLRDYIYAGEVLLTGKGRPAGCIGYKLASDHVFDYLLDFVTVYRNDPFFGLFWVNHISHNDLNRASGEDDALVRLMVRLAEAGALDTAMVVLLSDHGLRVGDFRRTRHGWLEDRLPLLFVSVPAWYRLRHPLHFSSLLANSERLTSPYDLHLTLRHVVLGSPPSLAACPACASLLTPVPHRSCAEAGVSPHWCACAAAADVRPGEYSPAVVHSVVSAINRRIARDRDIDPHFRCEHLRLKEIMYVRRKDRPGVEEWIVGVVTEPGGAEFEATVTVTEEGLAVMEEMSRLNNYGNESHCAHNPASKLFCRCEPADSVSGALQGPD